MSDQVRLESIITSISMDPSAFVLGVNQTIAKMSELVNDVAAACALITGEFQAMSTAVAASVAIVTTSVQNFSQILSLMPAAVQAAFGNAATGLSTTIQGMTTPINDFGTALARMGRNSQAILDITDAMLTLSAVTPQIENASKALARIGTFFEGVAVFSGKKMRAAAMGVQDFGTAFAGFASILNTGDVKAGSLALARVGEFIAAVKRFEFDPAQMLELRFAIKGIAHSVAGMAQIPDIAKASLAMTHVARMFNAIAKVDAGRVLASVGAMQTVVTMLNNMPVTDNAMRLSLLMQRVSNSMKSLAAAGGGMGGINTNIFGGTSTSLRGVVDGMQAIPAAAMGSATSTAHLTQAFRSLYIMSGAVQMSLYGFRLSLLGVGILGVTQFARLDDLLRRSMANMRDWNMENKKFLQEGLFKISGAGPVGATDLAKGLDIFTASGYSAAAAMKALAIAENYAVAGGLKVERASESLLEIMAGLGTASDDVKVTYDEMKKLSDLLVGVAARVPATQPDELARSFTGKFMTSAREWGMQAQDAMSLVATYATVGGKSFKGSSAGNFISRGMNDIYKQAIAGGKVGGAWKQILGQDIYDKQTGKMMDFIDVLNLISEHVGKVGTAQHKAKLLALGFEQTSLSVIEPLLMNAAAIKKMRGELTDLEGITDKTAAVLKGSLVNQLKVLWNSASNAANVFGQHVAPAFYGVAIAVKAASDWFLRLNEAVQAFAVWGSLAVGGFFLLPMVLGPVVDLILSIVMMPFNLAIYGINMMVSGFTALYSAAKVAWSWIVIGAQMAGKAIYTGVVVTLGLVEGLFVGLHSLGKTVIKGMTALFDYATIAVNGMFYAMSAVTWAMDNLGTVMNELWKFTVKLAGGVAFLGIEAIKAGAAIVANLVAGILSAVLAIGTLLVVLPVVITLLTTLAAVVGAFVLTAAVTLYNLAVMVGQVLVQAWERFKEAAVNAAAWAGNGIVGLNRRIGEMWHSLRAGTDAFIKNATRAIEVTAGFFWHFAHNMEVVWKYVGSHGTQMFTDLANAALSFAEIVGNNVVIALHFVLRAINRLFGILLAGWKGLEDGIKGLNFLGQFTNMFNDVGTVFKSFLDNFLINFGRSFELLYAVFDLWVTKMSVKWAMEQMKWNPIAAAPGVMNALKKKGDADIEAKEAALLLLDKNLKFNTPFQNMPALKTDWTQMKKGLIDMPVAAMTKDWFEAIDNIWEYWKQGFEEMIPFASAIADILKSEWFKAMAGEIKTDLPENWMGDLKEYINRLLKPTAMEYKDDNTVSPMKGGPGFKFMQLSLEREMIGGEVAEGLEYQQLVTLKNMDSKLGQLVTAANTGKAFVGGRPPIPITTE